MPTAAPQERVERDVRGGAGDDDARLARVIEDDTLPRAPRRWVERLRAHQTDLLANGEEQQQRRMVEAVGAQLFQGMENHGNARAVVSAEIGCAVAPQNAIAQNGPVRQPRRHAIHVGVQQNRRLAVAAERAGGRASDQVARGVGHGIEIIRLQLLYQPLADGGFLPRDARHTC